MLFRSDRFVPESFVLPLNPFVCLRLRIALTAVQTNHQKSAASQSFVLDVFNAGKRVVNRRHQHALKLPGKQALDQRFVLRFDLYKIRESPKRVYSSRLLAREYLLHRIGIVGVMRVEILKRGQSV